MPPTHVVIRRHADWYSFFHVILHSITRTWWNISEENAILQYLYILASMQGSMPMNLKFHEKINNIPTQIQF